MQKQKNLGVFNEQFHAASFDNSAIVSQSLAGGTIFQMDQTKSQNQKFLRYIRKRCKDSNLDCNIGICSGCHHEKAAPPQRESLHNATGAERFNFRKNTNISINYRKRLQKRTSCHL
jgi:hypothetical protein